MTEQVRCRWASGDDGLMIAYHDEEWGVPTRGDRELFELLTLEGAQAGLSWRTVLHRREGYRRVFEGFVIERVAAWTEREQTEALGDQRIIRNRLKVASAVTNARAAIRARDAHGSLTDLLWGLAAGGTRVNQARRAEEVPAHTEQSRAMSRELRRLGFSFVGPTICYALMQSAGMVNDHEVSCFRYHELAG